MRHAYAKKIVLAAIICFIVSSSWAVDSVVVPPLFRGTFIVNFPMAAFPYDSFGGRYIWFPIPEMGFTITPTIPFGDGSGFWEFPIHVMTFFPFLEKYGALGDIKIGAGFQALNIYLFRLNYRFIEGRYYPLGAKFHAHVASVDVALPIRGFSAAGGHFEWAMNTSWKMEVPFQSGGKEYNKYTGSMFSIAPFWRFRLKYGELMLSYRVIIVNKMVGTSTEKGYSYTIRKSSTSAFELKYMYP